MKLRNRCWLASALVILASPALAESTFDQEIRLLARMLDVESGTVVADIGAGSGEYSIALSGRVGEDGVVHATEMEAEKREAISKAARQAGADRVVVGEARTLGTGLPPASCDAIFLRDVYHHLTEPKAFTESLFETIRPGGRLVIIDFPPAFWLSLWTPEGVAEDRGGHGIRPELLVRELEAAGFERTETIDKWPSSNFVTKTYAIAFQRP